MEQSRSAESTFQHSEVARLRQNGIRNEEPVLAVRKIRLFASLRITFSAHILANGVEI